MFSTYVLLDHLCRWWGYNLSESDWEPQKQLDASLEDYRQVPLAPQHLSELKGTPKHVSDTWYLVCLI
jgi:hypothetical protein